MSKRMPVVYLSHGGGPCFFMDWSLLGPKDTWKKMEAWLRGLPSEIGQTPKAIVVFSAHWEESEFTVLATPQPPMLFDYYGFPKHTFELNYPAPGSPELAGQIQKILSAAGIANSSNNTRGFDHGVFVPFLLMYPEANIPVIQVSLKHSLDPKEHLALGKALAPLRDQGVLLVGSGMSYHNLPALFRKGAISPDSDIFDQWLNDAVTQHPPDKRDELLSHWSGAPKARSAHPREEHLIPLMVIAGAAGEDPGARAFADRVMGASISAFIFR